MAQEEAVKPVRPVNPKKTYNKCIANDADIGNYRVEEYCDSIGDDYQTCNKDAGEYCQQKCGKSHETIVITLPRESPQGLLKTNKAGDGLVEIQLGTAMNSVATIEPKNTECGIGGLQVYADKSGNRPLTAGRRLQSAFSINSDTQTMTINTDQPTNIEGYVSVTTLGDVKSNLVPFSISVCNSPLLRVKTTAISNLVKPVYALNEEKGTVIIPRSQYGVFIDANKCKNCDP